MKIKAKKTTKKAEAVKSTDVACVCETKAAAPKAQRVTFSVRAEIGSKVYLAGCFNNWDPTTKEMVDKKGDGVFTATVSLPPGDYQYKFVIDGTWCADPECPDWIQNDLGTLNSVKHVG